MAAAPQSDLERFKAQQNAVADASLESTRNMVRLVEESQAAGVNTISMLEQQGEQLDRIEGGLDNINAEMKEAEKHLTGMEKWCGLCVMPWYKRKKIKDIDDSKWETSKDGTVVQKQPGGGVASGSHSGGTYIERITNDAREDEMEENMQAVGSVLSNLKEMSQAMGGEIERQNKQLDKIGGKADVAGVNVDRANTRTQKLINN